MQTVQTREANVPSASHGVSAKEDDRWFWKGSVIEPSARGASEIRRVWLESLGL